MSVTLTHVSPAYSSVPSTAVGTYGDIAADLAERYGRPLTGDQRLAVDSLMSYKPGGDWAAFEAAICESRQNGKTAAVVTAMVFTNLFVFDADSISWTAHQFKTARKAFEDHVALIENTPELARRLKPHGITYANGEESIELSNGARLEYLARSSKGSGRGLGGKQVVMDESLILGTSVIGSLMPTMSARRNPQIVYAGSAGLKDSELWRSLRDRGRAGGDPSLGWVEWCAPKDGCQLGDECDHHYGIAGCALDNVDNWLAANPTTTSRGLPSLEYIGNERRAMPPLEFARERLGWWDDPSGSTTATFVDGWHQLLTTDAPADPIAVGVEVAPSGTSAAIIVCGQGTSRPVLELPVRGDVADSRPGTAWVVPRLAELQAANRLCGIWLNPGGPAGVLVPELARAGIDFESVAGGDWTKACSLIWTGTAEQQLLHRADDRLDRSVSGAVRRETADSWRWNYHDMTVDPAPLGAATAAYWGYSVFNDSAPNVW